MAVVTNHAGLCLDAEAVVVVACSTLSLYNAIELLLLIFTTFKQWRGLYFWSLLVSSFGVIPYTIGFMIFCFGWTYNSVGDAVSTYGWITMVTGQSFVLYSRLHLILYKKETLRFVLWMIIIDAIIFHIPTSVMFFGSNLAKYSQGFTNAYTVYEKVQMTGFCIQEFIISGIYLKETIGVLKVPSKSGMRNTMWQLLSINVIIIIMDIFLLGVEYRNLNVLEKTIKGVIYSVKLKLEFAILKKLIEFVQSGGQFIPAAPGDRSDFVDVSRTALSVINPAATVSNRRAPQPHWLEDAGKIPAELIEIIETTNSHGPDLNVKNELSHDVASGSSMQKPRDLEEAGSITEIVPVRKYSDTEYAEFMWQMSRS